MPPNSANSPSGLLEADEIIVKPFEVEKPTDLVREKMLIRGLTTHLEKARVGVILPAVPYQHRRRLDGACQTE
jgi:hypothetical protein